MAEYIQRIMTADGEKQIDYNALANLPIIPDVSAEIEERAAALEDVDSALQARQTETEKNVQILKYQMSNMETMAIGKLYNFTYDTVTGKTWTKPIDVANNIKVLELYGRKVENLVINHTLNLSTGELYNDGSLTVTSNGRTLTFNGTASAYTSFVVFGTGGDPDATYGIKTTPSGTCSLATPFVFVNQRWSGMPVSSVLDSFVISTTDVVCFTYHETFKIALANGWEPDGYLFGGETILRINEETTFDNFTLTFDFGTITAEENYIVKPQSVYGVINSTGETNELVVPEEVRQLTCYGLPKNYYNFNTGVYYQAQDLVDGEIVDLETPIQHTGYEANPWLKVGALRYMGVVTEPADEMATFRLYYQKRVS